VQTFYEEFDRKGAEGAPKKKKDKKASLNFVLLGTSSRLKLFCGFLVQQVLYRAANKGA
jgi:hypothetical protein